MSERESILEFANGTLRLRMAWASIQLEELAKDPRPSGTALQDIAFSLRVGLLPETPEKRYYCETCRESVAIGDTIGKAGAYHKKCDSGVFQKESSPHNRTENAPQKK